MRARSREGRAIPDASATIRTLAVILQAGATPVAAWGHLANEGDPVAREVMRRTASGDDLVVAIAAQGGSWCDVAAAWEIAAVVGAPLAEVLRALAESLQDAATAADDVQVALAEPAATARLMMWLPLGGLLLGFALGFDTLGVIFGSVVGGVCVGIGVGLVLLARRWTRSLIARAQPEPGTPGLHEELTVIALAGGASLDRARRLVADATRGGSPTGSGPSAGSGTGAREGTGAAATERVLALSRAAGIPAVELLRASAAQQRHRARVEGRMRAAALSSRLLVPLGVCTLPAFMLLGIAPLILSVLGTTTLGLPP